MKKFLVVLALVLCMALPAAADTLTAETSSDLLAKVAGAKSGDTIVVAKSIDLGESGLEISSDKTLTLQINEGCTLSASAASGSSSSIVVTVIKNNGNLTVSGDGTLRASGKGTFTGLENNGNLTISGNCVISADATGTGTASAYCVKANGDSTTIINGSVKMTTNAKKRSECVLTYSGSVVTIGGNVEISATATENDSYTTVLTHSHTN